MSSSCSSAASIAEMFNRSLSNFLDDLEVVGISSLPEYAFVKAGCHLLARVDPQRLPRVFHEYISIPFGAFIDAQDEEFLLRHDEYDTLPELPDAVTLVRIMKRIWPGLDATNKAAIWKHLQVLQVLSRRVACR